MSVMVVAVEEAVKALAWLRSDFQGGVGSLVGEGPVEPLDLPVGGRGVGLGSGVF